jgi:signal transduction histidine kinase
MDEVYGKNPRIFYGPNTDKEEMRKVKTAVINKRSVEVRTIQYRKSGTEFWLSLFVSPIFNEKNELTHWIYIMRDITEIMQYTEEISNQKKFTEDILNNIPADIAVFDNQHRYLFVNPNAIKDRETRLWMIGKTDFDYAKNKNIDDKVARLRRDTFNKTVESQKMLEWVDEHKRDNELRYVLRKFYPYFENRKLKFVIGYGIDITERKLIEIKLNDALEDIKKTNAELEQFAYVASHDLQEPLRMVTSFLTQLEKKYGETLDSRAKEYIYYAVDGAKRMRQIILDLLEFSRIGRSEEKMLEVDVNDIVKEVLILHSQQIEELKAEVNYDVMPVIHSLRSPMRQVMQNLIGNSLKYHKKDVPPRIFVQVEEIPGFWKFSVTDNGIGIDPLFHEKIFTIFQRLHNRSEYEGTGIGLAITKKIVETMGGKIWVSSEEQIGSIFYFTVPKKSIHAKSEDPAG